MTVEAWSPSGEIETRTETLFGVTTNEYAYKTDKREIRFSLARLDTWDNVAAVGRTVSGRGFYRASFSWDGDADGAVLDLGRIVEFVRVKINGAEAGPIDLNVPRADVSALLRRGENVIEIEYCSNLNNLQLSRGKVKEGILVNEFPGYLTKYESYGPRRALLIPYVTPKGRDDE